MRVLETRIETYGNDVAEEYGIAHIKLNVRGRRGWPDRMYLTPEKPFFVEYKRPGEKVVPNSQQERKIELLRGLGYVVYVISSRKQARDTIEQHMDALGISKKGNRVFARRRPRSVIYASRARENNGMP